MSPPSVLRQEPIRQVVLVVDDEPDILESLKQLIEDALSVEVRTASSGPRALEILHSEHIDLIVTDYRMPDMTGIELLRAARKVTPRTPRILMTAYPDLDLALAAINDEGIENFVVKPFDPDTVIENVFAVLFGRRSEELRARSFARAMDMMRRETQRRI